jgi:hypothetical protein
VVCINPKRTFTTLRYRQRLAATTPQREAELTAYVHTQGGTVVIDGYRVTLTPDGELTWEPLPQSVTRQLAFPFLTEGGTL